MRIALWNPTDETKEIEDVRIISNNFVLPPKHVTFVEVPYPGVLRVKPFYFLWDAEDKGLIEYWILD